MITRSYLHLAFYFTCILEIRAIIFTTAYNNKTGGFDQVKQLSEPKNSSIDTSENNPRMFGINTGNAETDHEAGMWLMALLGTLAAAVPVAFLSPNLGFKKRSIDEYVPLSEMILNANKSKSVYMWKNEHHNLTRY